LQNNQGINLQKGSVVALRKVNGDKLSTICIGLNWGAIESNMFFGLIPTKESVDLDSSVAIFDKSKMLVDQVYYGKLTSHDGAILHSGDDSEGDRYGDDGIDNEVIVVDLDKISEKTAQIVFFLNSFRGQDFGDIPYSKIRIYEGTPTAVNTVFATFNLSSEEDYKGKVSMIMGKIFKDEDQTWKFTTIGEALESKRIPGTIQIIQEKFL
jgi:tellurium resistance protein TerZ